MDFKKQLVCLLDILCITKLNRFEKYIYKCTRWWYDLARHGFPQIELEHLDVSFSNYMLPRLKLLKTIKVGYPETIESEQEWSTILDKIIKALELIKEDKLSYSQEDSNIIKEGTTLLGKYYIDLGVY
jgi:hypothetical protein